MTPNGDDLWLKVGIGFVAVLFMVSLPTWALGVILAVGLATRAGIRHLRDQETESGHAQRSPARTDEDR